MNAEFSIALEIFKNYPLSREEVMFINAQFEMVEVKKGDIILHPGMSAEYQYYIYSGCLRSYFIDNYGKESTIQFAINDWWISDYTSFFTTEKSVMCIDCIRDAQIYKISKSDTKILYRTIPKVESFFRIKLEKAFANFQKRILEHLTLSAKDRYIKFITNYPDIEQQVKNYHIASYLGITNESLSRIRKSNS
ncbi:Crp/Fnr family transcriptional regulator [Polaribacter sp. WD7]|uniref:Crp/Fnr family transcriptional regulator n=1 Tax=Polaribacter sp. WD7 TaxID=2269061 RepID=UPI000DF3744D|nr:Crp/Fnr family transcriptional regulator [Polaribacter sp. WD7]RCS25951.1 Crp/Fnr family transcriptional regulator [Polaribacter sp. WD7]